MIQCESLSKKFGGLTAVNQLSFVAHPESITAVIGPNGAGKTTLFNLITGFLKPGRGSRVRLYDKDITACPAHITCRLGIARTFQIPRLFNNLTVLENVTIAALIRFSSVSKARAHAEEVIGTVGLTPWRDSISENLPIGHRKLLELGRALATQPKFLLLDEIMGGLNPSEIQTIIHLLRDLHNKGISILMIEHVISAVLSLADHTIVVDHGMKIAEGKPRDVTSNPKVIEAYLGGELAEC